MAEPTLDPDFAAALKHHNVELPIEQAVQLQRYASLVWELNESINLTRHTTWDLFVCRDVLDSVHLAGLLNAGEQVLDLGSGGGVPGIPMAIIRPDVHVSLAESVGKRARVLDELVAQLNLSVPVYAARGEDLLEDFQFDTVTARAVGSLRKLCQWLKPHFDDIERLLVLKGPRWLEERGEARHHGALHGLELRKRVAYPLVGAAGEGVILEIWKAKKSPRGGRTPSLGDEI